MNVYANAYGLARFRRSNESIYSLALEAAIDLIKRFDIPRDSIDGIIVATSSSEPYIASIIAEMLNIRPKIAYKLEQICSSGSSAIIDAYSYIASGLCNNVLIVGVDRHDTIGRRLDWDLTRGNFKDPVYWAALYTKAHMRRFNTKEEDLALITVKNRKNAIKNEYSYFREELSVEEVMNSRMIVEPLRLYNCSYLCDGASALLLTNKMDEKQVKITGIGGFSVGASLSSIKDLTSIESTRIAANEAYSMARVSANKIDVAEVHDAFAICEILAYEDLGFTYKGNGGRFVEDLIDGKASVKINTRGGLLGTGHPVAATGISQAVEIVMQLRGEAGDRQVKDCRVGLIHNIAAAGTTSNIIIMERDYG